MQQVCQQPLLLRPHHRPQTTMRMVEVILSEQPLVGRDASLGPLHDLLELRRIHLHRESRPCPFLVAGIYPPLHVRRHPFALTRQLRFPRLVPALRSPISQFSHLRRLRIQFLPLVLRYLPLTILPSEKKL